MSTVATTTAPVTTAPALSTPAAEARPTAPDRCVSYQVSADADPGTLPRVLELVAKRGLVPHSLTSRLAGDLLEITMEVIGMVRAESDHVGNCLRQIPMVAEVTVSERTVTLDLLAGELLAAE